MGSVGDSYDNALAETVIGLFKTEVIRRRGPWRSLEAVEFATLEWVHWFNHRRLLGPIGHVPPAEAEARFHGPLENSTAPGFAGTPLTAYRGPMEVLEWMMVRAEEPRRRRRHETKRPQLRCGSGG